MVAVLGLIAAAPVTAASATTEPPAAPVTAASATTEPPAAPDAEGKVTDFLGYVGGPGGAASGDPIRIGYINQDGGSIVVSSTHDDGVDFAVQFINEQAGGIGGRPIEIVQCFIANAEEEGQQCGQQFANDDSIVAVISGPTVTGTQSFYAALAESKPVVHGVSVNPVDTTQPNVAVLNGGAVYILAPFATFAQDVLGVESAALTYSEETQSDAGGRAGVGVRDARHPDRGRAVPAEHARPHRPAARRRGAGCRHRDAGARRARVRQVGRGPAVAGDPRREGARQPGVPDPGHDRGARRLPRVVLRDHHVARFRRQRSGGGAVPGVSSPRSASRSTSPTRGCWSASARR